MIDTIALVAAVVAVLGAAIAIILALQVAALTRRNATGRARVQAELGEEPVAAIVVNPSKFADVAPVRSALEAVAAELGWAPPLWLETTPDDPGAGQARLALEAGADLVVACGGDGTIRCVAEALSGSGTPMGLVPAGTGNLLARNLDFIVRRTPAEMSPEDAAAALRVALSGDDRRIDVGWVKVTADDGTETHEQAFLVMAGMGFDAEIMAGVPDALKARVGVMAYFVSGLKLFNGARMRMKVTVDATIRHVKVRTVVIGNVGRVQGGLAIMPDAEVDDGWLDVVAIGPRGIVGWLDVAARVISGRHRRDERMAHWRGRWIRLDPEAPLPAQIDGDYVGVARSMRLRIDEGALLVRVAPDATRATLRDLASAGLATQRELLGQLGRRGSSDQITRPRRPEGATASRGRG